MLIQLVKLHWVKQPVHLINCNVIVRMRSHPMKWGLWCVISGFRHDVGKISQDSADLTYTAVEAWHHAQYTHPYGQATLHYISRSEKFQIKKAKLLTLLSFLLCCRDQTTMPFPTIPPPHLIAKLPTASTNTPSRISWPLKMGRIDCPKTLVQNYHSVLHNIPEDCRAHQQISWYTTDLLYLIFISMMVIWWGENIQHFYP
jgi:hypothetical protein